jgi:hypothetical protein
METPSFTSLAQIYNLDKIQKTWTPLTDSVLPVQFFASDDYQVKAVDPAKGVSKMTARSLVGTIVNYFRLGHL